MPTLIDLSDTPLVNELYSGVQLAGLAILGIGVWTKVDAGQFDSFLGNSGYSLSAYMMMAAGAFVAIVGFLGCCGAIKESRCLLGLVGNPCDLVSKPM